MIYVDSGNLKQINDTFGHQVDDVVIAQTRKKIFEIEYSKYCNENNYLNDDGILGNLLQYEMNDIYRCVSVYILCGCVLAMILRKFSVLNSNMNVFKGAYAFELQCDCNCCSSQPLATNISESTQQPPQLAMGFTRKSNGLLELYVLGCDKRALTSEATIAKTGRMENKNEYELHRSSS